LEFRGDGDMCARSSTPLHRNILSDADWALIETLLQDAVVSVRNLGSPQRSLLADRRLSENCEDDGVIREIKRLADTEPGNW